MKVIPLKLEGAKIIEPVVHGDHRGFFMESYNEQIMKQHGINYAFIQDNQSLSAEAGVIKGCITSFILKPRPNLSECFLEPSMMLLWIFVKVPQHSVNGSG